MTAVVVVVSQDPFIDRLWLGENNANAILQFLDRADTEFLGPQYPPMGQEDFPRTPVRRIDRWPSLASQCRSLGHADSHPIIVRLFHRVKPLPDASKG